MTGRVALKLEKIILTAIFFALGTFSAAVFADEGAEVLNWGQDRIDCGATCDEEVECVAGGQLTIVANNENATLVCSAGEWLFEPPARAITVEVNCDEFGTGQGVITPSGKVNFFCHTE